MKQSSGETGFSKIEDAVQAFKNGELIVLVDDESRENEGDLIFAAEKVTSQKVNFMANHGKGLICVAITSKKAGKLDLTAQSVSNTALHGTAFTVSVDAVKGTATGISAKDRAQTIRVLASNKTTKKDLARPGHVFPIVARPGGVMVRAGHTEAVVDLAKMAGLKPAGVLCEIISQDGCMMRLPDLKKFSSTHRMKLISVAQIIEKRRKFCYACGVY